MSFLRRFFTRVSPELARKMESESRRWMMQCQSCGHEVSVWDAGGIRYKARGTVRRLARCSRCNKLGMMRIYLRDDA